MPKPVCAKPVFRFLNSLSGHVSERMAGTCTFSASAFGQSFFFFKLFDSHQQIVDLKPER